jgi:uncharacterized protein
LDCVLRRRQMDDALIQAVTLETGLLERGVRAVIELSASGATVPFIARYRKEATGELDEEEIRGILEAKEKTAALWKRRESILDSLKERDLLNPDLEKALCQATALSELEDLYLPFRPKRKTRASAAREVGLEPLAELLVSGRCDDVDAAAADFIDPDKGITSVEDALGGARDIIAEEISESAAVRACLRELFARKAIFSASSVKKRCEEDPKGSARFRDYFDWSEAVKGVAGHRVLAVRRGAALGFLRWHLLPPEEDALLSVKHLSMRVGGVPSSLEASEGPHTPLHGEAAKQVASAAEDAYSRLLAPSLETELKSVLVARAEEESILRFGENLRELLLQPPLGPRSVLALDPGLRTGCKLAVISSGGALLEHDVIFPLPPQNKKVEATRRILELIAQYGIEAVAVGNGTGGRESVDFLKEAGLPASVSVVSVDESGASVYSASPLAREEFPDQDVTVRGAVSIGRRLQDPLAELVKIDPKSIGVGQYQHDVDQKALKKALDQTVESCVNNVGVELNSASVRLLSYVSGVGEKLASSLIAFRNDNGPFQSRSQLLSVPGLGPKAYEQAAGFLRIRGANNPLDASAVHPERYTLVEKMAVTVGVSVGDLIGDDNTVRSTIDLTSYIDEHTGMATLRDIMAELEKPGRDPRSPFEIFSFDEGVRSPDDLREGMILPGIVTNITSFGAFVDIGVHQDGLVHISHLADHFVKDPAEVVRLKQQVQVKVISVDLERRRIGLSMKRE